MSAAALGFAEAGAQASDRIRKIVIISDPQSQSAQAFQAAQLTAQG